MQALLSITIFIALGFAFIFGALTFGAFIRPKAPHAEKSAAYECGEPTLGSSWVQFDLRFYIIALLFLVFDVEVALFYPWAVIYGDAAAVGKRVGMTVFQLRETALVDMLIFFGILMLGFAYLWRFGYLEWVKGKTQPAELQNPPVLPAAAVAQPMTDLPTSPFVPA